MILWIMRVENWWNDDYSPVLSIITYRFRVNRIREKLHSIFSFLLIFGRSMVFGQFLEIEKSIILFILPVTHLSQLSFFLFPLLVHRTQTHELSVNKKKTNSSFGLTNSVWIKPYGTIGPAINIQLYPIDSMLLKSYKL